MKILYLSGAPRVSTHEKTTLPGPRSHILGVIKGFEQNGFIVDKYIVGDINLKVSTLKNIDKKMSNIFLVRFVADILRIYSSVKHNRLSYNKYVSTIDIVYERFGVFQSMGYLFKKRAKKLWILETNGIQFLEAKFDRNSIYLYETCKKLEIKAYRECDYLVCISNELKFMLISQLNIDSQKIIVIPNAVDSERFDNKNCLVIRKFKGFTIGFVGELANWSGIDLLLKAVKLVVDDGFDVHLSIIGDGIMKDSYISLINDLGLGDRVDLLGRIDWNEIPKYINGFDFAFSGQLKLKGGKMYLSPLKLYEYISMGKPIIAANFEDSSSLIKHMETGVLFKSGDLESLVDSIRIAYSDINYFKENALRCRDKLIEKHTWKARVSDLLTYLKM